MRVAVYAIALNEAKHVERWYESAKDADELVILDTGSTDDTVQIAERLSITIHQQTFDPFDFAAARNAALALVSSDADYCVTLDLDEILHPGWRDAFDKLDPRVTRPRYHYIFQRDDDDREAFTYRGHACHARHGYEWRGSIHESITPLGTEIQGLADFTVEHKPDPTKSREQYLPMLKRAYDADQDDPRTCFYLGRELMYHARTTEAIRILTRRVQMIDTHSGERSTAMRYLATLDEPNREAWLLRAAAEMPWTREAWVDLAHHHYTKHEWEACLAHATRALTITTRPDGWFNEPHAWGPLPHDLAALASHHLGLHADAVKHGRTAVSLDPADGRLQTNLAYYEDALRATVDATLVTH